MSVPLLRNLPPDCLDIVLSYADDNHPKASVTTQSLSELGPESRFDAVRYTSNNAQRTLSGFRRDLVNAVQGLGQEGLVLAEQVDKAINKGAIPELKKLSDKYYPKKFDFLFKTFFKLFQINRSLPAYLNEKSAIQSKVVENLEKVLPSEPKKPMSQKNQLSKPC